jgi:DNA-binding NtrC family response regulator
MFDIGRPKPGRCVGVGSIKSGVGETPPGAHKFCRLIIYLPMKDNTILQAGELACVPLPPRRILLVDDDNDLRQLYADVLVRSGYHVDTAKDGASGWRALNASRYDLVITDNTMPRVTGLDLIKKLRSEDMRLSVILASGTAPTEELNRCPWLQLDAVLPKPFSIEELLETVRAVLRATNSAPPVAQATARLAKPAIG